MHAAVPVLAQKPKPKKENVCPLCFAWGVQQKARQKNRPLATLIAELRQAVLAEGTRLRARGLAAQRGVSASSAPPLAKPDFASAAASSAEQPASINAVPSRVVRPVEFVIINGVWMDSRHAKREGRPVLHRLAQRPSSGA